MGPETAHSPNADDLNTLYWVLLVIAGILVVAINLALVAVVVRFRAARGREPRRLKTRRPPQVAAGAAFAGAGRRGLRRRDRLHRQRQATSRHRGRRASSPRPPPPPSVRSASRRASLPPLTIDASGQQWIWRYQYPDGTFSYYELVVPVDTAVVVKLDSTDVVHRWWVPGLGGKFDAVPGETNSTWFKADEEGVLTGSPTPSPGRRTR